MGFLSPAQVAGYFAFVLGVTAFLQKSDRRLKIFSGSQGLVYALHFVMLGNLPACASALISAVRTFLALRFQSWILAAAIVAVNLGVGAMLVKSAVGWLPVLASCVATVAMFTTSGVTLRCALLSTTFMWLVNDIVSGSIGGTLLELTIATVNSITIFRMIRATQEPATESV